MQRKSECRKRRRNRNQGLTIRDITPSVKDKQVNMELMIAILITSPSRLPELCHSLIAVQRHPFLRQLNNRNRVRAAFYA